MLSITKAQKFKLGLLLGILPSLVFAETQQWLDRMSRAMQELNYKGVFIYIHDEQVETMRIEHSYDGMVERERLLSLNGEAREVIRDNQLVTCIWPGSKSVSVSKARPRRPFPSLNLQVDNLDKQYQFHLLGQERIAGYNTRVIAIQPLDQFRYGYRLWLELESNLLLRSDLLDTTGRLIEQVMFTQLEILKSIPAEHFRPLLEGNGYSWSEESTEIVMHPDPMWKVDSLPQGFKLTSRNKKPMPPHDNAVEHMVFSDGLASVSLFIEPLIKQQQKLYGTSRMGGVTVFADIQREHQVTVVGEVPAVTAEFIGRAVAYIP